jgi:hypothetical protein
MASSEWMSSVTDFRDTTVAEDSAPSINTMPSFWYRPPITVSLFLHVLSVTYCKRSHWRCSQLRKSVGMVSMGTSIHWDWNAMGDAEQISPRIPSTCVQNAIHFLLIIHIIPSPQMYVAIDNPSLIPSVTCLTTRSDLWNHVHTAVNVSRAENLQSFSCQCFSHLYKFRDGVQVTRVFGYCGKRQR